MSAMVKKNGEWQLHADFAHKTATVQSPVDSRTLIAAGINESNIALTALPE